MSEGAMNLKKKKKKKKKIYEICGEKGKIE